MLANQDFKGSIDFIMLSGRWNQLLMQQFQFSADAPAVKYACLMDPWKKKVSLTLKEDAGLATLTVKGDGIDDTWTWKAAADANTPSAITGKRAGAELITLTGKDTAPRGGL